MSVLIRDSRGSWPAFLYHRGLGGLQAQLREFSAEMRLGRLAKFDSFFGQYVPVSWVAQCEVGGVITA